MTGTYPPADSIALLVDEAAIVARVSRSAIYEALRSGELPAVRSGRRTLIKRSDLEAWVSALPAWGPRKGDKPRRNP